MSLPQRFIDWFSARGWAPRAPFHRRALALLAPQPPPLDALVAAPAAVDVGALPRCVGCGAWGVGVMQAGGACAHCEREGRLPVSPSCIRT